MATGASESCRNPVMNAPETATSCHYFWANARNYDLDAPEITEGPVKTEDDRFIFGNNGTEMEIPQYVRTMDSVADQDQPIVENQRPEELPLDLSEELHLKGPDAVAVAYRRFMRELGVEVDAAPPNGH